ncbi:hypothetical protein [Falsirhodobacter algicola]|uniref:Uncharacterized protein n=1 Tax=Falsirhodobacter algicola TaxID=2692330 RepID=A0A8J8SJW2_9RHOB|nr:hypothetical protein [Falsirhodobacter algicola]QUS34871.1 hypothetical protein GR316_00460 [Falsirhodobacter algicola]
MRVLVFLLLAGCAPRPDIGPLPVDDAPAPVLLPQEEIAARIAATPAGPAVEDDLNARAAALRARAGNLR